MARDMVGFACVVVGVFLAILALSCATTSDDAAPTPSPTLVYIWVDRSTGCHYLYTIGSPLVPRLTEDGEHYCTDRYGNYKKKTGVLGVTGKQQEKPLVGEDE